MNDNSPVLDHKMLSILEEQLRMFKEQMQRKDVQVMEAINERTDLALKIKVTEQSIHAFKNPLPSIVQAVSSTDKPKFTKEWVRKHMKWRKLWVQQPAQTKEIVDRFYSNATDEEKDKAIKILSVVFNNLIKSGEVTVEKKDGIKGNFYVWNGDV